MTAPDMELRRAKQREPEMAGWHYGRPKGEEYNDCPIAPFRVIIDIDAKLAVWLGDDDKFWPLDRWNWYGPVPECVEASFAVA